jgi:hypothetical protein
MSLGKVCDDCENGFKGFSPEGQEEPGVFDASPDFFLAASSRNNHNMGQA